MEINMMFEKQMQDKVQEIEQVIQAYMPKKSSFQKTIIDVMDYTMSAGGKRIRPLLMKECYSLFGGKEKLIEPFMAAIEMIHTYSLIHDDLPALDNDDYRRGRKTTHVVYGHAMGILAGDALLNYAFETAIRAFEMDDLDVIRRAFEILVKKPGVYGMIGGQVVDVEKSGTAMEKEELEFVFECKTAALIEASMMIGSVLGRASVEEQKKIEQIARNIGIAFQIQDDILDVTSTTHELGKPVHSDERNLKTTYVTLYGMEQAKKDVLTYCSHAIEEIKTLQGNHEELIQLVSFLIDRKK